MRQQQRSGGGRAVLHAFKLYTGPDNASHVLEGTITETERTDVVAIHFKESPPHASFDWHAAPEAQYVLTLSGTLEFTTRDGETFVLQPGDVLVARDDIGSGHVAIDRRSALATRLRRVEIRRAGFL